MRLIKLLTILLIGALAVWGGQALYLVHENKSAPDRIRDEEIQKRTLLKVEYAQGLRELEHEYGRKKYLATGDTVFDRIFNTQNQAVIDLLKRIAQEALPDGWSSDVKVEEFTHFILLIYLPHNSEPPPIAKISSALQPIMEYCSWCLSDVAVFDRRHKSYLFFDKSLLTQMESDKPLSTRMMELARNQGASFTRFNSVTIECDKHESHLVVPIEIGGPNGAISCRALFDTGATMITLPTKIIAATGSDDLQTAERRTFKTMNGNISCPIVKREVNIGGLRKEIEVAVDQRDGIPLVGMNFFEGMDYIVDFGQSALYMWEK
jgi:predicted aspartyl protease